MKLDKGQPVWAKPYALIHMGWLRAKFVRRESKEDTPHFLGKIRYGVELTQFTYGLASGHPWWCFEEDIIPIPEGVTKDQIEALSHIMESSDS